MRNATTIQAGGVFLIGGALAFMGVFAFLAVRFNYPDVLDGNAEQVLPNLLATGITGRAVWAIYGFLPLIWIPAGVGAFHALRDVREGSMRLAMLARGAGFPRWIGYLGVFTAMAGMVGMFRNVTAVVSPIAAANNYLLPLWMIIFGVSLLRYRPSISEIEHRST